MPNWVYIGFFRERAKYVSLLMSTAYIIHTKSIQQIKREKGEYTFTGDIDEMIKTFLLPSVVPEISHLHDRLIPAA